MAQQPMRWHTIVLTTPDGNAGDSFHVQATTLDKAIDLAKSQAPEGLVLVESATVDDIDPDNAPGVVL
jgi:hypothetical protein